MIHHNRCFFGTRDDGIYDGLLPPRFGPGTVRRGGEIGWEEENELTNI